MKKNSSFRTIISLCNTMMGSSIIFFPVVYFQCGIVSSFIIMILCCFLLYKTCSWYNFYALPYEKDLSEVIIRILGRKWSYLYDISNFLLLYFVSIIYFLLISSFSFPLISELLQLYNPNIVAKRNEFTYSKYSY